MISKFMFATGIGSSVPVINNGRKSIDELEKCKHYTYWQKDIDLVRELNIQFLRYGPPIYKTFTAADRFDGEFTDTVFRYLKQQQIIPIVDLCHFGVPDWIGNFQKPDFPHLFAKCAAAKAALLSLTRSSAIEGKEKSIRVNAILPGAIDTPMLWENPNIKAGLEQVSKDSVGKPGDIAGVVAFLASEDAAFVQGTMIEVDGERLNRL